MSLPVGLALFFGLIWVRKTFGPTLFSTEKISFLFHEYNIWPLHLFFLYLLQRGWTLLLNSHLDCLTFTNSVSEMHFSLLRLFSCSSLKAFIQNPECCSPDHNLVWYTRYHKAAHTRQSDKNGLIFKHLQGLAVTENSFFLYTFVRYASWTTFLCFSLLDIYFPCRSTCEYECLHDLTETAYCVILVMRTE